MKHEQFSQMLALSIYGELSTQEDAQLSEHLKHCLNCQREREELKELHSMLVKENSHPSERLLWQARDELFLKLRRDARESKIGRDWVAILNPLQWNWAMACGALALICIGFFVGHLSVAPEVGTELDPFRAEGVRISNLLLEETGRTGGEVQLSFEATRNFQVEGHIDDQKIHRFLAYALINEQNAGTRLRAVNTIRERTSASNEKEVQEALLVALRRDENPAVRQQALTALQKYPFDKEIRDALVYVLVNDQNAKLRIEAINYLGTVHSAGQQFEQEVLGVLQQKQQNDENKYIRLRAKAVLEEIEPQFF